MKPIEPRFRIEAIQELMERDGLNASTFAIKASISRTLIGAWLSGVVHPQIGTLTKLCRVFGVPIDFFFDQTPIESTERAAV